MKLAIYSIRVRFLFSLFANILRGGLNFLTNIIIARYLMPADYGTLAFLLTSFQALTQFFDQGVTAAFYTFISRKIVKSATYAIYFFWLIMQLILILFFIAIFAPDTLLNQMWNNTPRNIIIYAFLAIFLQQVIWWSVVQLGEATRKTLLAQSANIIISLFYLIIILVMGQYLHLTAKIIFITMGSIYFVASLIMFAVFINWQAIMISRYAWLKDLKFCLRQYYAYCKPLFFLALVTFFYTFLNNWMLNYFGGSIQQGYYQIAYRFSAIALLATTSILRVFWKEVALLSESNDNEKMRLLFYKVLRVVFFAGAVGAGFMIPWAKEIILLFLGKSYLDGWLILMIMFLYPIHQSIGQVMGAMFSATSMTRAYSLISIPFMLLSIVSTYFLLAPTHSILPGLALGGVGLSVNMVVIQVISVNVCLYFFCKLKKWRFQWFFQFMTLVTMLILGYLTKIFISNFFLEWVSNPFRIIIELACAGAIYLFVVFIFLLYKPSWFLGLDRSAFLKVLKMR